MATKGTSEVYLKLFSDSSAWGKGLNSAIGGLNALEKKCNTVAHAIKPVDAGLAKLQTYTAAGLLAIGAGLAIIAKQSTSAYETLQSLNLQFETLLKSKSGADKLMADMMKFAGTAPFKVQEIGDMTKYLLANGVSVAQLTDKYEGLWKVFGNVAATMSARGMAISLQEVAALYERMQQGQMRAQMLLRVGLSKRDLLKYGIQFDETGQMVKAAGLPTEKAMQNAADAMIKAFQDKFAGGMERFGSTLPGMMQKLVNKLMGPESRLGKVISDQLIGMLENVGDAIDKLSDNPKFMAGVEEALKQVGDLLKPLVEGGESYLTKLVAYLQENPTALVDGLNHLLAVTKNLAIALGIIIGMRGLLGLVTTGAQAVLMFQTFSIWAGSTILVVNGLTLSVGTLIRALGALGMALGVLELVRMGIESHQKAVEAAKANQADWDKYTRDEYYRTQHGVPPGTYPWPGSPDWNEQGFIGPMPPEAGRVPGAAGAGGAPEESDEARAAREKAQKEREKLEGELRSFLPPQYTTVNSWFDSLRKTKPHGGIDMPAPAGTPVHMLEDVIVRAIYKTDARNKKDKGLVSEIQVGSLAGLGHSPPPHNGSERCSGAPVDGR